ncbi:hypothetical protein LTR86_008389 [Recurvomyces mirabilis]|nr:hypothetical protein LTR86_008389 [Recurvomyces mirabilis]
MPGFDFGGRFDSQANIGLGANSTLLNALVDAGHIASRTYSYWWGIDNPNTNVAMDGQIVFGGYDAAKTTGPNITSTLLNWTAPCPSGMYLTLTDVVLDFPNGTTSSILSPSSLSACIQPDFPVVMNMPDNPYYSRFENLTETSAVNRTSGMYWYNPAYEVGSVYSGDLTIVLNSDLSFKVKNDVLVVPDQYIDRSGARQSNSSADVVLIDPLDGVNANDPPIIGMQFLSAAYLMVDLDARTFTLWQANPSTESRLISVGGQCSEEPAVNSNATSPSTNSTSSGPQEGGSNSTVSAARPASKASTGTIAGAVVGAVLGLALIAGIVILVLLRRKKTRESKAASTERLTVVDGKSDPEDTYTGWHDLPRKTGLGLHEAPDNSHEMYEMSSKHDPVELGRYDNYELAEMPVQRTPKGR